MVAAALVLRAALWVLVILLLLGFLDFTYQRWQMTQDLKMTKHEVKDERKGSEGDMDIKRRRMMLARQIAMQRIAIDVPKADVIVTNPTHYSVAIEYKTDTFNLSRQFRQILEAWAEPRTYGVTVSYLW